MKPLEEQMSVYAAYHQDARNKATHFIGVPAIVLSLMIPLSWLRIDAISAAMVITAALLAYYLALDLWLGLGMCIVMGALLWMGQALADQGAVAGWSWFAALFVGGWILQLLGHVFEGRKPALADNLFQIFVAPIFLCAELFFALGYKPRLHSAVEERAKRLRTA
ncbi:MAG TPA: Mpo1-like protein [Burkholderiales bacterium]|nr:Mpo1-like protein [Burkholderiales bacterium]